MPDVVIIPEDRLAAIPEHAVPPGNRLLPAFFFSDDGSPQPWIADTMENHVGLRMPHSWLPYDVPLTEAWWINNGFGEAEAWLMANTAGPWMLWLKADPLSITPVRSAVFFRRVTDAVHFKLAMPS